MSADKHTPGPWEVVALSGWGGPWAIRMHYISKVPNAHPTWLGVQNIGTEANARLIAAAPELLECVQELKELFRFALLSTTPDIAKDGMEFIRKAEAAIAKATGQ